MVKNFGWKKKDEKPLWRKNLGEKKMENCQNDENIWVKKKDEKICGEKYLGESPN